MGYPLMAIITILLHCWVLGQTCTTSTYYRCICSSATPYCPCASITPTSTLNFNPLYYSHLVLVSGQGCRPCDSSCQKCTSLTQCSQCLPSFYLSGGQCLPCPINCQTCSNTICSVCMNQYYLNQQNYCYPCPFIGTNICTINTLVSCLSNYWLDNNAANCVNCDRNCQQCSSTTRCNVCNSGFYLTSGGTCSACLPNCFNCTNGLSCSLCANTSLYYNNTLGSCQGGTVNNCMIFSNSTACSVCANGYYLTSSKLCAIISTAIPYCRVYQSVNGNVVCVGCMNQYYQYMGVGSCRFGCSWLCSTCQGPHFGLCLTCNQNSYMNNLNCLPYYNINQGAGYQLYYTAANNPNFFKGELITSTDACLVYAIVSGQSISIVFTNYQAYTITIYWKIYKYQMISSSSINYKISFVSAYNATQNNSFPMGNCGDCSSTICINKDSLTYSEILSSSDTITFSTTDALLGVSYVLIVALRCGGVQGQGCLYCLSVLQCTKCVNANYFILAGTCVVACPASYYTLLSRRTCYQVCPYNSYTDTLIQQCFICQLPCATCLSATQCLTCIANSYLSGTTCVQTCPDNTYPDPYRLVCMACTYPCYQCLDNTNCLSCAYGFYHPLSNSCSVQCPIGTYGDLGTLVCYYCHSPCATCVALGTICTSCLPNWYYYMQQCLSQCPVGYYSSYMSWQCELCDSQCQQCSNVGTNCTGCGIGMYLQGSQCAATCPYRMYPDDLKLTCYPCSDNCLACSSAQSCTLCSPAYSYFASSGQCLPACPDKYYPSAGQCLLCQSPCLTCLSLPACLSCSYLFLSDSTCVPQCPSGKYADIAHLKCMMCDTTRCLTCVDAPTHCSSCQTGLILLEGGCVDACPSGMYKDGGNCMICGNTCSTCHNSSECVTCLPQFALVVGACVTECGNGSVKIRLSSVSQWECLPCSSNCLYCSYSGTNASTTCLQCDVGYLHTGRCVDTCPMTTYSVTNTCVECVLPCKSCISATDCTSCQLGYGILLNYLCLPSCPSQFYLDEMTNTCLACPTSCYFCNAITCTKCFPNFFLQPDNNSSQCVLMCDDGYYSSIADGNCHICNPVCLTCVNTSTTCTSCRYNNILFAQLCLQYCPSGYYLTTSYNTTVCQLCSKSCQVCTSVENCLLCSNNYYLTALNTCYTSCGLTSYASNGVCQPCIYPCLSCISELQCVACLRGYLYYNSCLIKCPVHSYPAEEDGVLVCLDCATGCYNCQNSTICTECATGVLVNGQCLDKCPAKFYPYYGLCVQCMYGCLNCSDSYTCNYCIDSYLYMGSCVEFCPVGWVVSLPEVSPAVCLQCDRTCSKCSVSPTQCLACAPNLFLYLFACVTACPAGSYKDYSLGNCVSCKSPCSTCSNSFSCITCLYGYILYAYSMGNQCIQGPHCPNSYYLHIDDNMCMDSCYPPLYIYPTQQTCSIKCPLQYVLYQSNWTCLPTCPIGMWINAEMVCMEEDPPMLPYYHCYQMILRNILLLQCRFTVPINYIWQLQVVNFTISIDSVTVNHTEIKILSNTELVLVTSFDDIKIKQSTVRVALSYRYGLTATLSITTAGQTPARLLQQGTFPLQNVYTDVFVPQFIGFTLQQREAGFQMYQIAASICIGALIFELFALVRNMRVTSLTLIGYLQWAYTLSLLDGIYPPNFGQFLYGFKLSSLIFFESNNPQPLWTIPALYRPGLWGVTSLFNATTIIVPSIILLSILSTVYLITSVLTRRLYQPTGPNDSKPWTKIKIIHDRFHYNYLFHSLLFTINPISLSFFCQIVAANALGLTLSAILLMLQFVFLSLSVYNYMPSKRAHHSSKYYFIMSVYAILSNALVVLAYLQLYAGVMSVMFLGNACLWQRVFVKSKMDWQMRIHQAAELLKILSLVGIIVTQISYNRWSAETIYNFAWLHVLIVVVTLILLIVETTNEFFHSEEKVDKGDAKDSSDYYQKKEEEVSANESSLLHYMTSMQESEQESSELAFFTARKLASDSDSDLDIVDFDEQPRATRAPTELLRVSKEQKDY